MYLNLCIIITVTVCDRDTAKQERVKVGELAAKLFF